MKILIAEDELTSRRTIEKLVQNLGHEAILAADGNEGWKAWNEIRPRILITDWLMPGMDGLDLCRKIRAAESGQYTYIIIVTSLRAWIPGRTISFQNPSPWRSLPSE